MKHYSTLTPQDIKFQDVIFAVAVVESVLRLKVYSSLYELH